MKTLVDGSSIGKSGYGRSAYHSSHGNNHRGSKVSGGQIPLESFSGPGRDARITTNVTGRNISESEESIVMKTGIMRTTDVRIDIVADGRSDVDSVR